MKKLLVAVVVLLALLVVADRVAESVAEGAVADQVRGELATTPDVEISGFPFLTQALSGTYEQITVDGADVEQSGVRVTEFSAQLRGVQVPLSDVVGGEVASIPVDQVRGTALIAFADIASESDVVALTLDAAGDQVRIRGTVSVLGQTVDATALSDVALDGDALVLEPDTFEVAGEQVGGDLAAALAELLDLRIPLSRLPYGLEVQELSVADGGVRITATAPDVVLSR